MTPIHDAIKNLKDAKLFSPAGREEFLKYLDTVTTEEALFSRLTWWLVNQGLPADQNEKYDLVRQRASELKLWSGLDLKMERWKNKVLAEYDQMGEEAFSAQIGRDYAEYYNGHTEEQDNGQALKAATAAEISEMLIPPIRYIVDELVPMGLGVLVAKPKIGKSWMILDLCLSVADGTPFLDFPTHQHGTLYLALEDGPGRMQRRIRKLLEGRKAPANMYAMFDAPRMDEGLLTALGNYLDEHPDIHLVCIDTLSKIKPKAKPFENAYDADYGYMGDLKKFADSRGICLLIVHHTRKGKNQDDSFDNINGSTGIMGASDFTIVLDKQTRMDEDASFILTGRDVEQQERVIRFDASRCRWMMQGTSAEVATQRRIAEYEENPIVKTLRELLLQGDGTWTGNAQKLMELGQHYTHTDLAPSSQALAKAVAELEPMLWERDAIKHWVCGHGTAGKKHVFKMNRTDNTADLPPSEQILLQT